LRVPPTADSFQPTVLLKKAILKQGEIIGTPFFQCQENTLFLGLFAAKNVKKFQGFSKKFHDPFLKNFFSRSE